MLPHSGSSRLPWKIDEDKLVGGLALVVWNHGILNDFPFRKGNVMIPGELHDFSEG